MTLIPVRFNFSQTLHDGNAGRSAQPGRAGGKHRQRGLGITNAAGSLDAKLRADRFRASACTSSTVASLALKPVEVFDEMRTAFHHEFAGADFFLLREQAGFEDDFHRPLVRSLHHVAQFAQDIFVVASLEPAEVEDDINLLRAIVNGGLGFKALSHRRTWRPVGNRQRNRPSRRCRPENGALATTQRTVHARHCENYFRAPRHRAFRFPRWWRPPGSGYGL